MPNHLDYPSQGAKLIVGPMAKLDHFTKENTMTLVCIFPYASWPMFAFRRGWPISETFYLYPLHIFTPRTWER